MLRQPHTPAVLAIMERTGLPYEKVKSTYNSVYAAVHHTPATPFPGAYALLELIKAMGILTAVISNKENDLLQDTLKEIGWRDYFDVVYGARPNKSHKPDPGVIEEIIITFSHPIEKEEIFFVGDALSSDIACALQAKVVPIWVSQYSIDEVMFGDSGPHILKTENCLTLTQLLKQWM